MNQLQGFYPAQFGAFADESSSFDPNDPNGPDGNEDNTDPEADEVLPTDPPKYRTLVKAKKEELKSTYGKGHFKGINECGGKPWRAFYSPNIRIPETGCYGKGDNKKCVVKGNEADYDAATKRFDEAMAVWHSCTGGNSGIWVPGWRAKWRDFKNSGGLDVLRQQSTGEIPTGTPVPNPQGNPQPNPVDVMVDTMDCQKLKDSFGIIPGETWGSAPKSAIDRWKSLNCFGPKPVIVSHSGTGVDHTPGDAGGNNTEDSFIQKNKLAVIIVCLIIIVCALTGLVVLNKKSKKPQNG